MRYQRLLAPGLTVLAICAGVALMLSGLMTSQAVQNPTISLDMDPSGNSYSDPGAGGDNSMTVGTIDNCLTTAAPGDNGTHTHSVHAIVGDVEDLVGWQLRLNYRGDKMRPSTVNFAPFTDTTDPIHPQGVSFLNLPIDSSTGLHRGQAPGASIPPARPESQTALIGNVYTGAPTFPISPDTPAKSPPDDTSYSALSGGVLAALDLEVLAGNAGQPSLFMNANDNTPNPPGSTVTIFTGSGTLTTDLPSSALGDGYHGEGATCVPLDCINAECPPEPPPVATPTPSSTPAGHDVSLRRIGGVPRSIRLSPGEVFSDTTAIDVENSSHHAETIGVYVDITSPGGGGCAPSGRLIETTVTVPARGRTTVFVPVNYSCADPSAVDGSSYTWVAVADHGGDDLAVCGPGMLRSAACTNGLVNDDESGFADNFKVRNAPQVIAQ